MLGSLLGSSPLKEGSGINLQISKSPVTSRDHRLKTTFEVSGMQTEVSSPVAFTCSIWLDSCLVPRTRLDFIHLLTLQVNELGFWLLHLNFCSLFLLTQAWFEILVIKFRQTSWSVLCRLCTGYQESWPLHTTVSPSICKWDLLYLISVCF